ncbi:MAG: carbohydrate binding family 9 domain-containing protein, partial [Saprospiraceae bacterium]|nr:carbohydrate binding family 9 domain-containing protein [Saprospiraceae bacterium]
MTRLLYLAIFLMSASLANANGTPSAHVRKTDQPITLDGRLDEAAWSSTEPVTGFWQHFPTDSLQSEYQTEIFLLYDDQALYVGARCYTSGRNFVVPSLKRDYRAGGNDNITFMFDPFNDGSNAFVFGINPLGVRREALITEGGTDNDQFQTSWDNKWDGTSMIHDDHWTIEIAIPFSTLRFNEGSQKWRFQCYRFDTQSNETMTWVRIPRNQSLINLAFMGDMHWEEPLQKHGANVAVIPYASGAWARDYEAGTPSD